jgi:hypothetical protein
MCAGSIVLLRRVTTCVVLVALVGIYAAPLAAAFSSGGMDCCAAGMCPRPGHSMTHHHAHDEMPDCGMGKQSLSLRKCEMAACTKQIDNAVNVGLFVLAEPMEIICSLVQVPLLVSAPQSERAVSQIPETPPPRTNLS